MHIQRGTQILIAFLLSLSLFTTGCSTRWIGVALADLPVLTQMALNIASLAATMQSAKQVDPGETAAIQRISAEASRDLNLLQTLYNDYKANPSSDKLAKIQKTISEINQNLPALLQAAHIRNATLAARVQAGVNLILTTVSSFAALIPQPAVKTMAMDKGPAVAASTVTIPTAKELKRQWNLQVCAPAGDRAFNAAVGACRVR